MIEERELKVFIDDISARIDEAIKIEDLPNIIEVLKNIKLHLGEFFDNENISE